MSFFTKLQRARISHSQKLIQEMYSILKLFMCIETICGKKVAYKDSDVRQCIQEYGAFRIGEREGQFRKIFEN